MAARPALYPRPGPAWGRSGSVRRLRTAALGNPPNDTPEDGAPAPNVPGVREDDQARYARYAARYGGNPPMDGEEWQAAADRLRANSARGNQNEEAALNALGLQNNNSATNADGTPRQIVTFPAGTDENGNPTVTRPDAVTD